jgi:cell division protease FtsH
MAIDAWLPVGFIAPDVERARLALQDGLDWQIYETQGGGRILFAKSQLAKSMV